MPMDRLDSETLVPPTKSEGACDGWRASIRTMFGDSIGAACVDCAATIGSQRTRQVNWEIFSLEGENLAMMCTGSKKTSKQIYEFQSA
jgi:hypothetical protein